MLSVALHLFLRERARSNTGRRVGHQCEEEGATDAVDASEPHSNEGLVVVDERAVADAILHPQIMRAASIRLIEDHLADFRGEV